MCGGRSSILHYGALIENRSRNLQYVCPDAEWECPSALLNKRNTSRNTPKPTVKRQKTDPDLDSDLE